MENPISDPSRRIPPSILAVVAFLGLALAVSGALRAPDDPEPSPATADADTPADGPTLARVGERALTTDDLRRAVDAQLGLRRGTPDADELGRLLESLVEEELLVQRARTLGLVDTDPGLRRALQAAAKENVLSTVPEPPEDELRRIYDEDPETYGERTYEQARATILRRHQEAARDRALEQALDRLREETPPVYARESATREPTS